MGDKATMGRNLRDQILDEMVLILSNLDIFDKDSIEKLKKLSVGESFTKQKLIIEAIEPKTETT